MPTLANIIFRLWLLGVGVLSLLAFLMGVLGVLAAAVLLGLHLTHPGFMPALSIPFTLLYMGAASLIGYVAMWFFKTTLRSDEMGKLERVLEQRFK
ncbi:MAG: hypothetical protein ABJD53_10865 [Gammaproteobacteria bacterium]